jgi:YggT family protein
MRALLEVIMIVLRLYFWIIIANAVMSWLVAFSVVNTRNQLVYTIYNMLNQLTEPLLRPIRRYMPNFGAIDISPMALLLIIIFLQWLIADYLHPNAF